MSTYDHINGRMKEKCDILLKILNRILVNINREPIKDFIDFREVKRSELLIEANEKLVEEMADEIFKYFNKVRARYSKRETIDHYLLTLLRCMCDEVFLIFQARTLRRWINKKIETCSAYSVVPAPL